MELRCASFGCWFSTRFPIVCALASCDRPHKFRIALPPPLSVPELDNICVDAGEIHNGRPGPRLEMRLDDPDGYVLMVAQIEKHQVSGDAK